MASSCVHRSFQLYLILSLLQIVLSSKPGSPSSVSTPSATFFSNIYINGDLSQNTEFLSFLSSNKSSYISIDKSLNPTLENCESISSKLPVSSSSLFISISPIISKIQKFACQANPQGLASIILISQNVIEDSTLFSKLLKSKIFGSIFKGLEKFENIEKVDLCEGRLIEWKSGECTDEHDRRLVNRTQLNETYFEYVLMMDVPGATIMMSMEEIDVQFFEYLVDELSQFAEVKNENVVFSSDYEVLHDAVIALMLVGDDLEGVVQVSYWDKLYSVCKSATGVSDLENFLLIEGFNYNEPAYYYLQSIKSRFPQECIYKSEFYQNTYPESLASVIDQLFSFYSSIFTYDELAEGSLFLQTFRLNDSDYEVIANITLKSGANCGCDFCGSEFATIEVNLKRFGFIGDVFAFKAYSFSNDSSSVKTSLKLGNDSRECFTFENKVDSIANVYKSVKVFRDQNVFIDGKINDYVIMESEIFFNFSSFGIYMFIQDCKEGLGLDSNFECIDCQENCKCSCGNTCESCFGAFRFNETEKVCSQCKIGYEGELCDSCAQGFRISNNSDASNTTLTCLECKDGFGKTIDGECEPCLSNCLCSKAGTCEQCIGPGFDITQNCSSCLESYFNSSSCDSCAVGFGLNQFNICEPCFSNCDCMMASTCDYCLETDHLDPKSNCTECLAGYKSNSSAKCGECEPTFGLDENNYCHPCSEDCFCEQASTCSICVQGVNFNSSTNCKECSLGYSSSSISQNTSNNSLLCDICIPEYGLTQFNSCEPCQPGCLCKQAGNCDSCLAGENFNSTENCEKCGDVYESSGTNLTCDRCKDGFGFNEIGQCEKCMDGCLCKKAGTCDSCIAGIGVDKNNSCLICVKGYKSSSNDTVSCDLCDSGFGKGVNETCEPCLNRCTCEMAGTCTGCVEGSRYDLDVNCSECSYGYFSTGEEKLCNFCDEGFGSNSEGLCAPCLENCLCNTSSTCNSCSAGFILITDDKGQRKCEKGYPYPEMNDINSKLMNPGFTGIDIEFKSPIDLEIKEYGCMFLFENSDELGSKAKCRVASARILSIYLGNLFSIDDKTPLIFSKNLFLVKSSLAIETVNLTINYSIEPTLQSIISSVQSVGLECISTVSYPIKFSSSSSFGSFRNRFSYSWQITGRNLNYTFDQLNDPYLTVEVFEVLNSQEYGDLEVNLTIDDNFTSSLSSQTVKVYNNKKLKVQLDTGTSFEYYRSSDVSISSMITDKCGCKEKIYYIWDINPSVLGIATTNSKLRIPANILNYGDYNVSVQLNCGTQNISGSSYIQIRVIPSDLVIKTDKIDQEISSISDLTIRAHYSYDPDNYEFDFYWSYDYSDYLKGLSTHTVPKSLFSALSSFSISLQLKSSQNSRVATKTYHFTVIPDLPLTVSVLPPNSRVALSSQSIIKSSIKSTQAGQLAYQWSILIGDLNSVLSSSSTSSKNLVIPANTLQSQDYSIKLTVSLSSFSSSATINFKGNSPPACSGSLTLSPSSSTYLKSQKISISVNDCQDGDNLDYPLIYKLSIRKSNNKYSLLLYLNEGNFNDLRFPIGVTGCKVEVCDSLADCIEKSASFSITGLARNLKQDSAEMHEYLENKNFMNTLQAIVFALLNKVDDQELIDLMWDDFVIYVESELHNRYLMTEVASTVLLFVDEPQDIQISKFRIPKYLKFLSELCKTIQLIENKAWGYLNDIIDRVQLFDDDEKIIVLTFELISAASRVNGKTGVEYRVETEKIEFYLFEDLIENIKRIELGQSSIELKDPGFSQDSLVRLEAGVYKSGKYSDFIYLDVSTEREDLGLDSKQTQVLEMNHQGGCTITTFYRLLKSNEIFCQSVIADLDDSSIVLITASQGVATFEVSKSGIFTLSSNKKSESRTYSLNGNFFLLCTIIIVMIISIIFIETHYQSLPQDKNPTKTTRNFRESNKHEDINVTNLSLSDIDTKTEKNVIVSRHLFLEIFTSQQLKFRSLKVLTFCSAVSEAMMLQAILEAITGPFLAGFLSSVITGPTSIIAIIFIFKANSKAIWAKATFAMTTAIISLSIVVILMIDQPNLWALAFICGLATEVLVTESLLAVLRRCIGV